MERPARAAVFLDRDGTLIEDRGPLLDPAALYLLPGVAAALRRLAQAGYLRIVVTNQSAIGRGLLDRAGLDRVHAALRRALAAEGASFDALYFCPEAPPPGAPPESPGSRRKPGAGMLVEAAREHGLELSRCWMVGDQSRDTLAGKRAGCRGSLLLRTGQGSRFLDQTADYDRSCSDLGAAVDWILAADRNDAIR
jgi:D-glycero-D-manno-heptose 1,7-bisphosphate phosphatase